MPDATLVTDAIDPNEAAHFGALAADWWNPAGSSAMLHRINPVRLRYIRDQIDRHWGGDQASRKPLVGKRALDMGCGAGLLCEPLARMGADITGVDAAPESIAAAKIHAASNGWSIDYRAGGVDAVAGEVFDLVTSLEVIEHVSNPADFIAGLRRALTPGGLMILSTPNRTIVSRVAMVMVGEGLGLIPKGTHDWTRFLTPDELTALLTDAGMKVIDTQGFAYDPLRGARLTDDLSLDYFVTVIEA